MSLFFCSVILKENSMTKLFLLYLLVINVAAFVLYGNDKRRAVRHQWRIPEVELLLAAFLGGGAGAFLGMHLFHHKTKKWKFRILVPLSTVIWVLAAAFLIYTGQYYHAGETAEKYIENADDLPAVMNDAAVTVTKEDDGYFFDGPGSDTAVIFCPGAKVQTEAYAPLMYLTAQEGYDCFLLDMPFHLAFFGMNRAEEVMEEHSGYDHWYISGHSLGGAMAGIYASKHLDAFDGVIFMAAYPTKSLKKDGFRALSIYGSNDGVLNQDHYQENLSLMPDDFTEVVIDGGNHSQFGDYGRQAGDGKASIREEKQWTEAAEAVKQFLQ